MKYKGIEINDEWDVFIGVAFEDENRDDVVRAIFSLLGDRGYDISVEVVLDDYLIITSDKFGFTFESNGIGNVKHVYELLKYNKTGSTEISVDVQAHDWVFKNGDDEYNTDSVTLDEFLESLEE